MVMYIIVSSANKRTVDFISSGRSLIYIKKSIGPIMEPCGTPLFTGAQSEKGPLHTTHCVL